MVSRGPNERSRPGIQCEIVGDLLVRASADLRQLGSTDLIFQHSDRNLGRLVYGWDQTRPKCPAESVDSWRRLASRCHGGFEPGWQDRLAVSTFRRFRGGVVPGWDRFDLGPNASWDGWRIVGPR